MHGFRLRRSSLIIALVLLIVVFAASPLMVSGQGGGPAAYYAPSYTDASWNRIFNLHRSWGNVVPGGVRSPNGLWCVHPNYRPGQVLGVSANGRTITCTVGDMVNPAHLAQWRSRWVIELSWSAFVALGLDGRNVVDSVWLVGAGGAGPAPAQTQAQAEEVEEPAVRHFPETGYDVGHAFLDFWRQYGGLAVFGYPLSNELDENGRTVQYFERAVFEFHPENPPDHRVLLRLLGTNAAAGLWGSTPFQPVEESPDGDGTYFSRTGHHVRGSFLAHWNANGGLRVFGYPISEEFVQDGRVVQYFERAILEWHPDNDPEHRVLARRLGAKMR